jgi:general secretion pathway protein A
VSTPDRDPQPEGYEPFFGLREAPFGLAPDPRFLFASASHSAALAQVTYALERREPLVVVTGEIGTGKTLLCRTVLQRLERKTFLSIINDPLLERDELLKQLLQDFGAIPKGRAAATAASRHDLADTLHTFLQSLVPIRAHAVVIIDEAQHLRPDVLEQIRLLSNASDDRGTLLQIILVGQTDLETLLARPELRQMQQRISRRLRLEPLTSGEVREYIEHRIALARAGRPSPTPGAAELSRALAEWSGPSADIEFAPDAIEAILQFSSGLPRVINLLCDRSLEQAHVFRLHTIDGPLIHMAARALGIRARPSAARTAAASETEKTAPVSVPIAPSTVTSTATASAPQAPSPATPTMPTAPVSATTESTPAVTPSEASETSSVAITPPPGEPVSPFASLETGDGPRVDTAAEAIDRRSAREQSAYGSRLARGLALAASAVLATAAIWFGVRATQHAAAPTPTRAPVAKPSQPSAATPATAPPEPEPPLTTYPALPETARSQPTSPPRAPSPSANPPSSTAPTTGATPAMSEAAAQHFDIVVASFHTDTRATSVATQVSALNLPVRRRVADGWQQVICGPFSSRGEAEAAQQNLDRAGLTGTQIVPAAR